jgi:sec-independent protein translocase protein TatB
MFPEGRLFDFLIVGAVALIVVGPKDLPMLMRKVGQFMARMRAMAAEFRASFDEMARQSELDELRREVQALRSARPLDYAAQQVGAEGVLSDIKTDLSEANAVMTAQTIPPAAAQAAPAAEGVAEPAKAAPEADPAPKAPAP